MISSSSPKDMGLSVLTKQKNFSMKKGLSHDARIMFPHKAAGRVGNYWFTNIATRSRWLLGRGEESLR